MPTTVIIEEGYRVTLPEHLRQELHVGDELVVSREPNGGIVLMPLNRFRERMEESFGIWADREDIPVDGPAYVEWIRRDRDYSNETH